MTLIMAWVVGAFLVAPIGLHRRIGFVGALAASLVLSPLFGLFITLASAQIEPVGCDHCGNQANETRFCALCGKNKAGRTREEEATLLNAPRS